MGTSPVRRSTLTITALVTAAAAPAAAQSTQAATPSPSGSAPYHVVKHIAAGGEGGWDYLTVDTATHRLYVSRGTHVMVVDLDRDSVAGDIGDTPGVHGIALAPDLGRGYVSNGRDSSVTVFDLRTLAPVARVRGTGRNPDAILYEPTTHRVFTFNGGSNNATVIDAASNRIVGTVALGGRPEFAQADGRGRVFVNLEDKSAVVAFDARTLAVRGRYPLAPCEEPTGMAIDRAGGRLFVGCGNKQMAVVDAGTGRVVTTVPAGDGIDATAFDPGTRLAFASAGDGTLTVAREGAAGQVEPLGMVETARSGRTMALDERTHRVYVAAARFGPAPAATAERPRPRPAMIPGSFEIVVLER